MAVSTNVNVRDGIFTPYHQARRTLLNGLVGTLYVDAGSTGAAGGGTHGINIRMRREEFGFPILWVPTLIGVQDNLASAEVVELTYQGSGNRRLIAGAGLREAVTTVATAVGNNVGQMANVTLPIEGRGPDNAILSATWATNTDTKLYHLHVFGPVYDLQVISRLGYLDEVAAGLR